jgi:hypothetical protein
MSTDPFQELPSSEPGHASPPEGTPSFFPVSPCPLPSRFWKVALGLDRWSAGEQMHLASCPDCLALQQRVAAAARNAQGPVIGAALDIPAAPQPQRSDPVPEPPVAGRNWFWRSWLGKGLSLFGSFCVRLTARPGACQRQTRRQRPGIDSLENRDTMSGFFPWNPGWQPGSMSASPDRARPAVLAPGNSGGAEVSVPGSPDRGKQAWLQAFAWLIWSDPAGA